VTDDTPRTRYLTELTPRELADAVTPLLILPGRLQHEALTELVIRCEVAERLARGVSR